MPRSVIPLDGGFAGLRAGAIGIGGDQADNTAMAAGAVYIFR
jgi:hypothetical protein